MGAFAAAVDSNLPSFEMLLVVENLLFLEREMD